MASGSARPRIESVAEFVLTVDEPVEDTPECPTYDTYIAAPTYTLVGDAAGTGTGDQTLTLDSDALVIEEDGDSYVLAVVILTTGQNAPVPGDVTVLGHTDGGFSISDDGAEPTPDYLTLDGWPCFNGGWRHKTIFDGTPSTPVYHTCLGPDGDHSAMHYSFSAHVGFRACTETVPAGTTITFDTGAITSGSPDYAWQAQAILIKNAAPETSVTRSLDVDHSLTAFDEGGALFCFSFGGNEVPDMGDCGIFDGIMAEGSPREAAEGDDLLTDAESVQVKNFFGEGGPSGLDCECENNTYIGKAKISVTMIAGGTGSYTADEGTLLDGFATDTLEGLMIPGQGYA